MSDLRRAAENYKKARAELERAIREAADQSLRQIAAEVGWSHEQIRRIIQDAKK